MMVFFGMGTMAFVAGTHPMELLPMQVQGCLLVVASIVMLGGIFVTRAEMRSEDAVRRLESLQRYEEAQHGRWGTYPHEYKVGWKDTK